MSFRVQRAIAPLAFALLASQPLLAAPAPTPAGATGFRLGTLQLFALRDMDNVVPNDGSVFGVGVPKPEVSKVLQQAHAPADRISLSVDALLVRMPGHVVLLDTGLGPKIGGSLMASLAAAHVRPEDVTDILITHSHGDHVGGLATRDGAFAFPRATIRMSATEWSYMQAKGSKALVETIRAKVQPFKPGAEVVPGITSVPLAGHTPGHIVFHHPGSKLALVGDVLFRGSVGRWDFERGNQQQLIRSITTRLWPMGDETAFVPGHGPMSTFGHERATNPFVSDAALAA